MEIITAAGHGLYGISYLTGIHTVRIVRHIGRRLGYVLAPLGRPLCRLIYKGLDWLLLRHARSVGREIVRIGQGFDAAGHQLKEAFRRHPLLPIPKFFVLTFRALRRHGHVLVGLLNLAAPVAAAFVLASTIRYWSNLTYALSLEYDGQQVGYISNEAVFDTAATMAVERVINTDNSFEVQRIPKMTLAVVAQSDILSENEVCDQILKSSSSAIEEASGLYIDGRFEGSMSSREALDALLNSILSEYTDGSAGERAEFIQDVEIVDGLYPTSSLVPAVSMDQKLTASMVVERHYTVESGDTPIGIAAKNSMTLDELRALNPDLESLMLAGREVLVQRAQPYLRVKVIRTVEYTEAIPYSTEKVEDTTQYLGYQVERNAGQNGESRVTAEITLVDGVEQSRSILSTETITEPVNRVLVVGAKKMNPNANIG
ncbi:MAG: LysM peptidoglycan-binding domain-containing protein, partial [Clostridiales bacterium]|nr:LysM peptidoglycan-binding domain-containing protein [Clostridiales bacterium]